VAARQRRTAGVRSYAGAGGTSPGSLRTKTLFLGSSGGPLAFRQDRRTTPKCRCQTDPVSTEILIYGSRFHMVKYETLGQPLSFEVHWKAKLRNGERGHVFLEPLARRSAGAFADGHRLA